MNISVPFPALRDPPWVCCTTIAFETVPQLSWTDQEPGASRAPRSMPCSRSRYAAHAGSVHGSRIAGASWRRGRSNTPDQTAGREGRVAVAGRAVVLADREFPDDGRGEGSHAGL